MQLAKHFWSAAAIVVATAPAQAAPVTLTFDDLTTRDNFVSLGIESTYQGFEWGYSIVAGLSNAVIPASFPAGWASATVAAPAIFPAPTPVSGNSYAWNWLEVQSLYIDFQTPHDVNSGYFSAISPNSPINADSIQLIGYDVSGSVIASTAPFSLSNNFQQLNAGFTGVRTLEIRANERNRFYAIDDLTVTPASVSDVPEPTSIALFGTGAIGLFGLHRRKRKQAA